MAYKLQLPAGSLFHPVFHASHLKKRIGPAVIPSQQLPLVGVDGQILVQPVAILQRRMVKENNQVAVKLLIQWANLSLEKQPGKIGHLSSHSFHYTIADITFLWTRIFDGGGM